MVDIFFRGLGSFFEFTFKPLPYIGFLMNFIIIMVGIGLLGFWLKRLYAWGPEDAPVEIKKGREIE